MLPAGSIEFTSGKAGAGVIDAGKFAFATQEGVADSRGINVAAHDVAGRVDSEGESIRRLGVIERGEIAVAQQKAGQPPVVILYAPTMSPCGPMPLTPVVSTPGKSMGVK